jgi:hypothetical protein
VSASEKLSKTSPGVLLLSAETPHTVLTALPASVSTLIALALGLLLESKDSRSGVAPSRILPTHVSNTWVGNILDGVSALGRTGEERVQTRV